VLAALVGVVVRKLIEKAPKNRFNRKVSSYDRKETLDLTKSEEEIGAEEGEIVSQKVVMVGIDDFDDDVEPVTEKKPRRKNEDAATSVADDENKQAIENAENEEDGASEEIISDQIEEKDDSDFDD
jgi:hypothetical protein